MSGQGAKIIAIVTAFVVAAAVIVAMQLMPGKRAGALVGGPFTLTDQYGKQRSDIDFRGKYMLIYFGYTTCPDVCPTALQEMTVALDELGDAARDIQPIFITVDPERDTVARMKEFAANFHPRLLALTGSLDAVKKAAKEYRVYFAKAKNDEAPDGYLMDHTSIIYLMDRDGRYLTHFTHQLNPSDMAKQIRDHLS